MRTTQTSDSAGRADLPPGAQLPLPSAEAQRHSAQLSARIRQAIAGAGGWIDFAAYMELALYAPGLGYYAAGSAKLGASGDFVTAPEISPLFGATLATQVAEVLDRTGGDVVELGAGSGRLAADVLAGLRARDRLPARYRILEISPDLRQRQQACLLAKVPELFDRIEWLEALPQRVTGVVLANEVLDALPVHLLSWREEEIFERGVVAAGAGFGWDERELGPGRLREAAAALPVRPPYASELALAAPALVATLAGALDRGALLLIDYGFGRGEYYHPQRSGGTLMCHYRHRAHDDPFYLPGLQDITAHLDFTALAHAGIDAGLQLLGYTTQAQFLINCGIADLLARTPADHPGAYLPLAAGVQKLLSPAEMGELFKVMALGRGIDTDLVGFARGDKSRLL